MADRTLRCMEQCGGNRAFEETLEVVHMQVATPM